jgi:serine/threonine-protein kinase
MRRISDGDRILGTFVVERFLGEGAFAEVYRVRHRFLGRQAMKVFRAAGMTLEETERLLGEAIMLSTVGHPNVIRVFDANTLETRQGTCGFFTMEYIAGGSLERFWKSHGERFIPVPTTVEILIQVCRGLSVAHDADPPIVHRDIKPQNLLVGYDGAGLRVRVSDFGLAKRVNPLSLMASARGTAAFKAPETFVDPMADSCAGDVWAIGMTAYLLLTDHLPYAGLTEIDLLKGKAFERPIIPPSRLNLDIDPALEAIVLRALELDPRQRYKSAGSMLAELVRWVNAPHPTTNSLSAGTMTSKVPIGADGSPLDDVEAAEMIERALVLARQGATLSAAADLMEEAINKAPGLRERHAYRVRLWRNGVIQ